MTHRISDEGEHGAPYNGFVRIDLCADVTLRDCVFQAHRTYQTIGSAGVPVSMGSYDLRAAASVNVSCVNCRQTTDISDNRWWGLFCSDFCKNLLFDGCTFSRFDAHMGVAGATVRNCTIGYMGLSSIGFGTFTVENTTIRANGFVRLRPDYGSSWDGTFVIRNCRYEPPKSGTGMLPVIVGKNDGTHDFGYGCCLPDIDVDGLFIDDTGASDAVFYGDFGGGTAPGARHPIRLPARVALRHVTTASGRPVRTFSNPSDFRSTKVVVGSRQ